ncbi:unnamed protein product [Arabidopsis halleri]
MGFLSCWYFLWDIIHNDKHLSTLPETEGSQIIETRICALSDDLLLQILRYVPTKEAVATSVLSKRWRYVWTMVPRLEFKDDGSESVGWFIEKSLQLHKAPKLDSLIVELGLHCPVDVDVGKLVENAVNRDVEDLDFKLLWTAEPTRFPKSLYTSSDEKEVPLASRYPTSMGFLSCLSFLWDIIHIDKNLSTVPETEGCQQRIETRIYALPDDLLLQILHHVPTKEAVATSILSKRWRYVWTMVPRLEFKDEGSESVGCFIEKSLQLHKAPKLDSLIVELGQNCPFNVDVGKWVENAVNRGVEELDFKLLWTAEPTRLPMCLYTCDTLVDLTLSNQILVDVSSPACLPSLLYLSLHYVVYKDEESLVRLLSSSPVLKWLTVHRHDDDNLKTFTVKVSSLETLFYMTSWRKLDEVEVDEVEDAYLIESLVIDSPALTYLTLVDVCEDYCLIENMPCIDVADIGFVDNPSEKFLRSLSSVIHLHLFLTKSMVPIEYISPTLSFFSCS